MRISILCLFIISILSLPLSAQDNSQKVIRIVKEIKNRVGSSGVSQNEDSIASVMRPSFDAGVSVGVAKNLAIDLDFSTVSFNPHFNLNEYVSPFIDKGFATVTKERTNFRKTMIAAGVIYSIPIRKSSIDLSLHGGVSLNKYPDFTVTQNYNGATTPIAKYSAPINIASSGLMKTGIGFHHNLTSNIGFYVNSKYVSQFNSTQFEYNYKDISKVDYSRTSKEIQTQIDQAATVTQRTKGVTNFLAFGAGITFSLGKRLNSQPSANVVVPLTSSKVAVKGNYSDGTSKDISDARTFTATATLSDGDSRNDKVRPFTVTGTYSDVGLADRPFTVIGTFSDGSTADCGRSFKGKGIFIDETAGNSKGSKFKCNIEVCGDKMSIVANFPGGPITITATYKTEGSDSSSNPFLSHAINTKGTGAAGRLTPPKQEHAINTKGTGAAGKLTPPKQEHAINTKGTGAAGKSIATPQMPTPETVINNGFELRLPFSLDGSSPNGELFLPKEKIDNRIPFFVVYKLSESETLKAGDTLVIEKNVLLPQQVANSLQCKAVYLEGGRYQISDNNGVSISILVNVTPGDPLFHAISEKGTAAPSICDKCHGCCTFKGNKYVGCCSNDK